MIRMRAQAIAEIMDGVLQGNSELVINGEFIFDSRQATAGSIFIALAGEARDGHDFVADAIKRGAILSIVTKPVPGNYIQVSDPITAIAKLAAHIRANLTNLKIVAITGSQGKTTTKDLLQSILSNSGSTIAPVASFNNEIGVPITLLKCDDKTKFCILEMGARHQGDIARLTEIAKPDVGVVLRVGSAHLGEFGSREKIAEAKGELIRGLASDSIAILGTYDEFTPKMADALKLSKFTFGESVGANIRAADVEIRGGFPVFDLVTPEGREHVELQLLGAHQIANALAAAAAAFALGIKTADIAAALSTHRSASKWRMELLNIGEITLINDAYNANPESMAAALRTLRLLSQESGGNSWAFLGKMHELGSESPQLHREIGEFVAELGIDHLVAIGEVEYVLGAKESATMTHSYRDPESSFEIIEKIQAGDVVLVKASRAEHLESIAERISEVWTEKGPIA